MAGTVLLPIVLPWLPTPNFSTKGFVLGLLSWLPLALAIATANGGLRDPGGRLAWVGITGLGVPAAAAFLALDFSGAAPITSGTGVEREIFRYVRPMAAMGAICLIGVVSLAILRLI